MELQHLAHLVAVADQGSLQRAATTLGLTPAALTKSVRRLEAGLAATLLDRTTRPARLTSAGRKVVERARQALAVLAEVPRDLVPPDRAVTGRVRLGVGPLVAESLLASVVAQVLRRAPQVAFTVRVGHWRDGTDALKLGESDLFLGDVTEATADATLFVREFPSMPIAMICRSGHPLLRQPRPSAADVLRYPLVANTPPAWGLRWLQDLHRRAQRPHPDAAQPVQIVCDHATATLGIVRTTDAIGFSPRALVEAEVRAGRVVVVPFDTGALRSHAGSVSVAGRPLSAPAELVREVAHLVAAPAT